MKLGIMQPYFLPYLGYFQLINSIDRFVLLDDVNFIRRGWINRNKMLANHGDSQIFTIPVCSASINKKINQLQLAEKPDFRKKLLKTFQQIYQKAPQYSSVWPLIERIILNPEENLASFVRRSLIEVLSFLEINTEIVASSSIYDNSLLKGQERIMDICIREGASDYLNPEGGVLLYNPADFEACGIKLGFQKFQAVAYRQYRNRFVANLSVVDVLMFNSIEEIREMISSSCE